MIALRAAMASVPDAMLIALTSVYARRGEVWRIFEKHFGRPSADVLVVNGATTMLNPTISHHVIDAAYADDPVAAAAEYGAEFRCDVEAFLPPEALDAVRVVGRFEQPFAERHRERYVAFLDPAGGTGTDSMTMAIAHHADDRAVLDLVRGPAPVLTGGDCGRVRRRPEGVRPLDVCRGLADRKLPQGGHRRRAVS